MVSMISIAIFLLAIMLVLLLSIVSVLYSVDVIGNHIDTRNSNTDNNNNNNNISV